MAFVWFKGLARNLVPTVREIDRVYGELEVAESRIEALSHAADRLAADSEKRQEAINALSAELDSLKSAPNDLAFYAITSMGRSGSTLLRNELIKSREVCCLASGPFLHWLAANHRILAGTPHSLREHQEELREQWVSKAWFESDIRYRHARTEHARDWSRQLGSILLCKDALFVLTSQNLPILHNFRLIHLLRDPLAVALSYARVSPVTGRPFIDAGRTDFAQLIRRFADDYAPHIKMPPNDELATMPSHVAAAHLVGAFYRALAAFVLNDGVSAGSLLVRFEDLCSQRDETLARIRRFMGLPNISIPNNAEFFAPSIEEGGIEMAENTSADRASRVITEADPSIIKHVTEVIGDAGEPFGYRAGRCWG